MTQQAMETIKVYHGNDVGASQCLVTLEGFIGDMDNAELADDSTVDTSDAVTAINGLIWSLEQRDTEIERLRAALTKIHYLEASDADIWIWQAQEAAREALADEQLAVDEKP